VEQPGANTPEASSAEASSLATALCWVQGIYFLFTGVWPLVSIETFQMVTGRKTDHLVTGREADHWMVNTIAALVISIAVVLLFAAWRKRASIDVALLGIASAAALTIIDIVYVARGVLSPIYLVDAAIEVLLGLFWIRHIIRL
jgi:hypothetical protein